MLLKLVLPGDAEDVKVAFVALRSPFLCKESLTNQCTVVYISRYDTRCARRVHNKDSERYRASYGCAG